MHLGERFTGCRGENLDSITKRLNRIAMEKAGSIPKASNPERFRRGARRVHGYEKWTQGSSRVLRKLNLRVKLMP